jgi:hypothetical protein
MKSRNVLLNSAMHAKISDVSLFRVMSFPYDACETTEVAIVLTMHRQQ